MSEELRECPFCGGDAQIVRDFMGNAYRKGTRKWLYLIECTNIHCPICPQTGQTNQRQRLINDWNRRPPVDSVAVDIMERVKAECTKHQKGVGAAGCNSCPLAGEGFNCVLDGPASHWNMPAMEAALADSTGEG